MLESEKQELMAKVDLFVKEKEEPIEQKQESQFVPNKETVVDAMFDSAVVASVATDNNLKQDVFDAAKKYTRTKMKTIETKVDTENKQVIFQSNKDACACYGFANKEDTTPAWAVRIMRYGYNVVLALRLVFGTLTFMPIIFVVKKISVGLKHTWLAVIVAICIYLLALIGTTYPLISTILEFLS